MEEWKVKTQEGGKKGRKGKRREGKREGRRAQIPLRRRYLPEVFFVNGIKTYRWRGCCPTCIFWAGLHAEWGTGISAGGAFQILLLSIKGHPPHCIPLPPATRHTPVTISKFRTPRLHLENPNILFCGLLLQSEVRAGEPSGRCHSGGGLWGAQSDSHWWGQRLRCSLGY